MSRITVSRPVEAPVTRVWPALADLGSHVTWMKDAESLVFTTEQVRGVGTVMEVATRLGPFRTRDIVEVTDWQEGSSIEVAHRGLVRGMGLLSVEEEGAGSRITWEESLTFPWWLGGPVTAWLANPILAKVWKGNLDRLARLVSGL